MEITLNVDRAKVYKEVAMTTSYTGAKMVDADEVLLDRISTVDEDKDILDRFWNEARAEVAQNMIGVLQSEAMNSNSYALVLNVSASFDEALQASMELSLFSYFVQSIIAKWFVFTNKQESGEYADNASTFLSDVREKAFFKKKPKRPVYV
mgnify:CR=1 FL=1